MLGSRNPKQSRHRFCLRELLVLWGDGHANSWLLFYVVSEGTVNRNGSEDSHLMGWIKQKSFIGEEILGVGFCYVSSFPGTHTSLLLFSSRRGNISTVPCGVSRQGRGKVSLGGRGCLTISQGEVQVRSRWGISGLHGGQHRVVGKVAGLVGGWFNLGFANVAWTLFNDGPERYGLGGGIRRLGEDWAQEGEILLGSEGSLARLVA